MKKYKHLFFDLDHTLWDFDRNSKEVLHELFHKHSLRDKGVNADEFISRYIEINHEMWRLYHLNKIDRDTLRTIRFEKTFAHFEIDDEKIITAFPDDYLDLLPSRKHLFPMAIETLEYLMDKYSLHLITNGFERVQFLKLDGSGLTKYFEEIIISEKTGYKKPDKEIFLHALEISSANVNESIMIGDDMEADIKGAINAGMDVVYFNPEKKLHEEKITFEINSLSELKNIF
ncbi:MAG: YjjG family noncanonical pyrimidine nucleotidase [Bacteroidia bacterium]